MTICDPRWSYTQMRFMPLTYEYLKKATPARAGADAVIVISAASRRVFIVGSFPLLRVKEGPHNIAKLRRREAQERTNLIVIDKSDPDSRCRILIHR